MALGVADLPHLGVVPILSNTPGCQVRVQQLDLCPNFPPDLLLTIGSTCYVQLRSTLICPTVGERRDCWKKEVESAIPSRYTHASWQGLSNLVGIFI